MRIIFMGTPEFAVPTLEALIKAGHDVCLAVTQPDRPCGRGHGVKPSPVKKCAAGHDIPVFQPEKIRDPGSVSELRKYGADIIAVVAFGQILPKEILEMTPYGCVNMHASLLPRYRGAAPISRAIMDGETKSGVSAMLMDEGLDTGDILMKSEVVIEPGETGGSLHDKLASVAARLCVATLDGLLENTLVPVPQGEPATPYAKMIDKSTGKIDWSRSAAEIERLIRALSPSPGAYTYRNGTVMKIWEAEVCDEDGNSGDIACGTVAGVERDAFLVRTGAGLLKVKKLQTPGKNRTDTGAFLRGNRIEKGELLG